MASSVYKFSPEMEEGNIPTLDGVEQDVGAGKSDEEKASELPQVLQSLLRMQAGRNKWLYMLVMSTIGGLCPLLFFSFIFGSPTVGATLTSAFVILNSMVFACPDIGKGIFIDIIAENQEEIARETRSRIINESISNVLFSTPFMSIPAFFALSPDSTNHKLFGEYTSLLLYCSFACSPIGGIMELVLYALVQKVHFLIPGVWEAKIEDYVDNMQSMFLQVDMSQKEKRSESLELFYRMHHQRVEKWAFSYNKKMSVWNGLLFGFPLYGISIFTVCAGVLQMGNSSGANSWKVVSLGALALMMLVFFLYNTHGLTKPNRCWARRTRALVANDPRLQCRVEFLFGHRFDSWLNSHEISAIRVFGIQVTPDRLWRIGTAVGSTFTILVTLIVGEEVRRSYQQQGGS